MSLESGWVGLGSLPSSGRTSGGGSEVPRRKGRVRRLRLPWEGPGLSGRATCWSGYLPCALICSVRSPAHPDSGLDLSFLEDIPETP